VQSVRDKDAAGSRLFAMKVLKKEAENIKNMFENERKILATLHHQNILEMVDAWEDRKNYHILTGLCQGIHFDSPMIVRHAWTHRSVCLLHVM
jgi:serine/threonine protein kinase